MKINLNSAHSYTEGSEVYVDLEKDNMRKRKQSRVHKLYEQYKNLSSIERDNFLNLIQNKGRF